jgi:hypothetical protein
MDWMLARQIKLIEHPPYSPDLARTHYFLFPRVKRELAGLTLTGPFKNEWEGAVQSIAAAYFTEAICHEKCVAIDTICRENLEIQIVLTIIVFYL